MTEYTPTEPEIAAALASLTEAVDRVHVPGRALSRRDVADLLSMERARYELDLLDAEVFAGPEQVRKARAQFAARERWAEQETKAA